MQFKLTFSFSFIGFIFLLFSWLMVSCSSEKNELVEKYNVVLIMTDDQGWGDFSINGNDILETPTLDQFSKEGATFNRFYVSPVCAPTRASLLTGRYNLRTGTTWVTHHKETMRSEEITLAEILKSHGYATGCFGKWHNGKQYPHNPNGQGFDEFIGFTDGHFNNYFDPVLEHNNEFVKTEGYISDVFTDYAIDFIQKHKDSAFFCYVPYNAPHGPFQVPDEYYEKYAKVVDDPKTAAVYAMCENIDDNVGRILVALDSLGLKNNTIVAFLTDNGPNGYRYNGGMKGIKGHVDEGGVRVPFYLHAPGVVEPGTTINKITAHIDVLPTILDLCQIDVPDDLSIDGKSLKPLLGNTKASWQERMIYTQYSGAALSPYNGSVRTEKYRLTLHRNGDTSLFDMVTDPNQRLDISKVEPEMVQLLADAYQNWYTDVTAKTSNVENINVGYELFPVTILPAPDAHLQGNVGFKGGQGWANDWIINWENASDKASWNIETVSTGEYAIDIHYAASEETVGSAVKVNIGEQTLKKEIEVAADAPVLPSPDRIPRKEVYEREWATMRIGNMDLKKGSYTVDVQLTGNIEGFELKEVIITFTE